MEEEGKGNAEKCSVSSALTRNLPTPQLNISRDDDDADCASLPKRFKPDPQQNFVNELNPLMVELVLEKLFSYCTSPNFSIKDLRLVCKTWNREASKSVRSNYKICFNKIINPYPDGLGWTETGDGSWYYEASESRSPFEKIKLVATCDKDANCSRWFEVMGSSVKHLHFQSSLACYHHIRFLECILKKWCKNLQILHLEGVSWYNSFHHFSRFDKSEFICELKDVRISGESEEMGGDCEKMLPETYLTGYQTPEERQRSTLNNHFDNLFQNIARLIVVEDDNDYYKVKAEEMVQKLDARLGTDGGILGQILKQDGIEKFCIKKFPAEHCDTVLLTMNRHSKRLQLNLREFEFDFPLLWDWRFTLLRKLQFPLAKLQIGPLAVSVSSAELSSLLSSFKDTLQHLDLDGSVLTGWEDDDQEEFLSLTVPYMPKLETFENKNIFCTRIGGLDFVRNLPRLNKCSLTNAIYHSSIYPLDPTQVFNLLFQAANFDNQTHSLNELCLNGKISYTRHVELLGEWFPQLRKVELTLNGTDVFVEFLRTVKKLQLEDLKLSFYAEDQAWCNSAFALNVPSMKKLRFLELIQLHDFPLTISQNTCSIGFARAPELTSLKLENFAMFIDEVEGIRSSLSKISCVEFPRCVFHHRPMNVNFSVGCKPELPFEPKKLKDCD